MTKSSRSAVLNPPCAGNLPPEPAPPKDDRRPGRKRKPCPYCLLDLNDYDPKNLKEFGYICPICRHPILDDLLTTPVYQFTREQQWDLLANEMEYIWDGEQRDVNSYVETMGGFYNPDFSDAKERLLGMLLDKDAVRRLREEFIEAEEEMDLLIVAYLNKKRVVWWGMAERILAGRPFRLTARRLSMSVPSERERVEFQLGLIMATPWGAFWSPAEKEEVVAHLEKILEKLTWAQEDMGA